MDISLIKTLFLVFGFLVFGKPDEVHSDYSFLCPYLLVVLLALGPLFLYFMTPFLSTTVNSLEICAV